jgi:hypothetical protein
LVEYAADGGGRVSKPGVQMSGFDTRGAVAGAVLLNQREGWSLVEYAADGGGRVSKPVLLRWGFDTRGAVDGAVLLNQRGATEPATARPRERIDHPRATQVVRFGLRPSSRLAK